MRNLVLASTALLLTAAPVHAQLVGGLGGTLGGTLGGFGGTIGAPMDSIGSTTGGTLRGSAATRGSHKADRNTGQVQVERSADIGVAGDLTQATRAAGQSVDAGASGAGSASGSGAGSAQLIGADAVRGTAASLGVAARGALNGTVHAGQGAVSGTGGAVAGLSSSLGGSGSAASGTSAGTLSGAGNLAAAGQGALTATKGTPVVAADGDRIGRVRQVIVNARGEVQQLLVKVDGATALLPAANFTTSGSAVASAMTEGQIKQVAEQQDAQQAK